MTYADRKKRLNETLKPRQEWWSRVFATPIAHAILHMVADWKYITPNRLTITSLFLTLLTAICISFGARSWLLIAAVVLQVAYVFDCMDGQLARYRGVSTASGSFLDKWSDFVKFPMIILALTIESSHRAHSTLTIVAGLLTLFFICYEPYLRCLAKSELSIEPWDTLTAGNFIQRNLRFFLFEEAQWYLIVSACLLVNAPIWALIILCVSQGIRSFAYTIHVLKEAISS
jgi:phosphatidylglycerophosphate synthase